MLRTVIGIAATDASSATKDSTTRRMTDTAYDTGAVVFPTAFGTRPMRHGRVLHRRSAMARRSPPDTKGMCPLAFQYNDGDGTGVSSAVTNGIVALANGLTFNVHVVASDVDAGAKSTTSSAS